jgi:membrane dipeptidase
MEPFEHSVAEIAKWNQLIAQNSKMLCKVLTAEDIVNAKKDSKVGVIFGFQNAAMLGSDAQRAAIFAGLGVRIVQLTYNVRNQLGDGSMVAENKGLTAFGHECVEALNANNLVIDLSHSGEQTCLDAIAASKRPICISHTGCRALSDLPRNKSDKELRLLADKGGVVGIYFMPFLKEDSFPNAMDVVRHIEHAINICGEDHVGIGTDGGTTRIDDMQAFHRLIDAEVEQRQKAGISAKGEKKGVVPMIPDLQGPEQFQQLADMLYRRGHSSTRIEKILGGNFLRLNRDIWGA